jgi:hypothetical protein
MKNKQTLEEVIENILEDNYSHKDDGGDRVYYDTQVKECILEGTNYQDKKMYSEEEVGELVYNIIGKYANESNIIINGDKINELFQQFKKK